MKNDKKRKLKTLEKYLIQYGDFFESLIDLKTIALMVLLISYVQVIHGDPKQRMVLAISLLLYFMAVRHCNLEGRK